MFTWYSVGGVTIWDITCTLYNNRRVTPPKQVTSPTLYRSGVPYRQNCHAMQATKSDAYKWVVLPSQTFSLNRDINTHGCCYVVVVFHQKIVAFENAFDRLLEIITEEGYSDGGIVQSPLTDTSLSQAPLLPEFVPAFLYSLYFTLYKMDISLRQTPRCKENHFYSLPFGQAEASILLVHVSFQLAPKTFWLAELISQFFCYSNSSKKHHLPWHHAS